MTSPRQSTTGLLIAIFICEKTLSFLDMPCLIKTVSNEQSGSVPTISQHGQTEKDALKDDSGVSNNKVVLTDVGWRSIRRHRTVS